MHLNEVVQAYVACRDIERASVKPLNDAVNAYSKYLARNADLADLAPKTFNAWVAAEVDRVARRTAKNYRASLVTLWRWAYEEEKLTEVPPLRLRSVKAPLAPVEAYTPDEVERIFAACDTLTNRFCRPMAVQRKQLYRALILAAWHTGFRPNDMMHLRWSGIADNGCVQIIQHKTKLPVTRWLDRETLGACEAIRVAGVPLVFGQFTCLETWRSVHRDLKRIAGVTRGTPKWIRRAMGTAVAVKYGEDAAGKALGHQNSDMARKHYIDRSQLLGRELRVPRLRRRKLG